VKTEQRILVVDDDDAIRTLLFTVLRRRGFRVDTARNGEEAIEHCTRCLYSVVVLDLMMPRMSGLDFLQHAESWPEDQRPLILVVTAGLLPRHLNPRVVAGTLRKPFDIEMLVETITACMRTYRELQQRDTCPPPQSETSSVSEPN
jgi:two-component system nitrogen regulation response regulator GlnG